MLINRFVSQVSCENSFELVLEKHISLDVNKPLFIPVMARNLIKTHLLIQSSL